MSDADKSLEIKIVTKAELAGAEAVLTSLQNQIGAARSLGKETADLEAAERRAATAIDARNEKSSPAARATMELETGHDAFARVPHPIDGGAARELGEALERVPEGSVGWMNGLAAAASRVKTSFEELDKQARRTLETLEDFGEVAPSIRQSRRGQTEVSDPTRYAAGTGELLARTPPRPMDTGGEVVDAGTAARLVSPEEFPRADAQSAMAQTIVDGGRATQTQAGEINALAGLLSALNLNSRHILQVVAEAHDNMDGMTGLIVNLQRAVKELGQRVDRAQSLGNR